MDQKYVLTDDKKCQCCLHGADLKFKPNKNIFTLVEKGSVRKIWKFEIDLTGKIFAYNLPKGSRVLGVGYFGDVPVMWISVDPSQIEVRKRFCAVWTGVDIKESFEYIDTLYGEDGKSFWHIVEIV